MRLLLYILLFSSLVHSQKFDGYVVTNANDTIRCKFFVQTNLFDTTMFYPNSVKNKVKIFSNGQKIKYEPNQIKSFYITGTKFGDYKFISLPQDGYKHFYHETIVGKISFYKIYLDNLNGGFPQHREVFVKEKKIQNIRSLSFRKDFGELIKDYPELYSKWIVGNDNYKLSQVFEVIQEYNKFFEN
jgi:hypothetical protein